ncbi:ribosomal RNA-processing protein 17 [Tanacetum coccineum]
MEADGDGLESEVQAHHIKKRSLKNKALSVSFNEKDLSDFVTGFHKRKKKRRKEAQNQQQEALRRKRIELRKKRKEDRDYVLYGGAPPGPDAEPNEFDEVEEAEDDEDDDEQKTSVSGTCRIVYLLKIENNQDPLLDNIRCI